MRKTDDLVKFGALVRNAICAALNLDHTTAAVYSKPLGLYGRQVNQLQIVVTPRNKMLILTRRGGEYFLSDDGQEFLVNVKNLSDVVGEFL